ncbi:CYTH domain-containing protein [Candidatus Babeliales bacterium]|nr:CYTH domain-containing protein [Candidatus Babeliales bacterium]
MKKKLLFIACAVFVLSCQLGAQSQESQFSEEIEIKIKLTNEQSVQLANWLEKNAQHCGTVELTDSYFQHPSILTTFRSLEGFDDAHVYLRVRTQPGKASVCCKTSGEQLERRIEAETAVSSGHEMVNILTLLGFYPHIEVKKTRVKYEVAFAGATLEVALDQQVQGSVAGGDFVDFGNFTEIEIKGGNKEVAVLYNFLQHVGISEFQLSTKSYYHIVLNPTHNFYETRVLSSQEYACFAGSPVAILPACLLLAAIVAGSAASILVGYFVTYLVTALSGGGGEFGPVAGPLMN